MTLEYVLKQNGVEIGEDKDKGQCNVRTDVQFAAMAGAFAAGEADFTTAFEPTATQLEKEGTGYIVTSIGKDSGKIPYTAYSATKSYMKDNKEVLEKFTRALENAMGEAWNEQLRKAGGEYGAATGRPRRVGPFDCVASRYGLSCQGADKIALTKLDVLSSMKEIPVITGYKLDGVEVPRFDPLSDLDRVQPVVTLLPGWNKDISGCKSWDELPNAAKQYVEFLEKQLGHEIQFVSTGAEREKFVLKGEWL